MLAVKLAQKCTNGVIELVTRINSLKVCGRVETLGDLAEPLSIHAFFVILFKLLDCRLHLTFKLLLAGV